MDKILENRYPTHFWISIYRGFGDRLGIGARGPGDRWIVPLGGGVLGMSGIEK